MSSDSPKPKPHVNKAYFSGILTRLEVPSDKAPSGSRGHRVVLSREAAAAALESLVGMGVDYKTGWDGHDAKQKCGVITAAEILDDAIHVDGYLYARDFPEMMAEIAAHPEDSLGMSYELADARVEDMRAKVWRLTACCFTGAAILLRNKAAYGNTRFQIHAGQERFTGHLIFEPQGSLVVKG